MRIIIDNGHGCNTKGKRSPDGRFEEWRFNRAVAGQLGSLCARLGWSFHYLVPEREDIPLNERVRRANAIAKQEDCVLISIHANAAGNGQSWSTARGWSAYTTKGKTDSDRLATCLYDAVAHLIPERTIRKDMQDGDEDWEENFYILRNTTCPAVLVENYFYDNREECEWLLLSDTPKRIADALAVGIAEYMHRR